jgi:lysyl endopeptidase
MHPAQGSPVSRDAGVRDDRRMTTRKTFRALRALAAAALCVAAFAAHAVLRTEPEVQPPWAAATVHKVKRAMPVRIREVRLEAAPPEVISKELAVAGKTGKPLQIGMGRPVTALQTAGGMAQWLTWEKAPGGGMVGAVSVTSPGAVALRAGMRIGSLPREARLRFYGPDMVPFEVSAEEVRATIARNLYFDEDTGEARMYWSPVVESSTLVIEIQIPAGASPGEVRVTSPIVSHLVTSAEINFALPKAAASCNLDAMCHQGTWALESNAVARIIYTRDGASYVCSGTLVADRDAATYIPYFLTAHHCVDSQTTASTVQTYWFYRATACNRDQRGNYQTQFNGATLLYETPDTDTSFLRLNGPPPEGATYAGWIVGAPPDPGQAVTGLHHPTGDLLKISFGAVSSYNACISTNGGAFSCGSTSPAEATFFGVRWQSGITEAGSSGSALFLDNGHYLIGQLYGGSGDCKAPGTDFYGRFDVAYNRGLHQWLGGTPQTSSAPTDRPIDNYSDLWWNREESGWGISITQHNAMIFAAWYIYDDAGRPTWVVMPGGQWTAANTFTGDLYMASGPDPRGAFDPARVVRNRVGTGTLVFNARDRGVLTYQLNGIAGVKSIERQLFGPPEAALGDNYTDLWWNAGESGWGLSIAQQYRTLFAVWYAYGSDGQPIWYVLPSGRWTGSDTYTGTLYRTAAAPDRFAGNAFNPNAVARSAVGTMTLRFNGAHSATMSYSVDGVSGTKAISRQPF